MEEELNGLWLQAGGEDIGSFEDFKTDLQSDAKMQEWAWKKFGGEKVGSLDDFKVDFGFTTPAQKPAPKVNKQVNIPATPIVALPKTKPVRINVAAGGINWAEGTLTDPDEEGNVIANLPKVSTIKSEISDIDNQLKNLSGAGVQVVERPGKAPKPNAQGYSWESGVDQVDVMYTANVALGTQQPMEDRKAVANTVKTLTKDKKAKEQQKKDVIVSSLKATDVNNYIREDVYEDFEGTIAQKGGDDRAFYETLIDGTKDVEDDIKFVVDYNMKQLANKYSDNFNQYLAESAQIKENSSDEVKQKFAQKYKDIIQDPLNTEIWELQEKYNQVQPFKDGVTAEMFKDPEVAKLYADQEETRKNREGITTLETSTGIPLLDQGIDIVGRNLARGIARAGRMVASFVPDDELQGKMLRRASDIEKRNPKSTIYEGIAEELKIDSDDFEFVFENETDTDPIYARNKETGEQVQTMGNWRDNQVMYKGELTPVADILDKNKKYKESNLSVYTSMFSDTVLDLFTQVGATKAVAVPLKFVGAGQRAAYTVGSAMSAFGQTKGAALEDLIKEKGLTADQREWLSTAKGLTTSAVNFINPIEAKLASGELSTLMGKAISRNAAKFAKGEIPLGEMVKVMGVSGLKGAGSELAEEGGEKLFDTKVINPIANKLYGTNLVTETSDGEWESIIKISAGVGLLADVAGNIRYDKSDIQTEALKTVVTNPEMYKAYIEGMKSTNAEHANALDRVVRPIVDEISILGEDVSDKTKLDIASSMLAAQKLSQDIAKISNPVLAKTKQAELDALYSEIATMESGSKKTSGTINYEKGAEPAQDYEVGDELMIGREPRVITSIVKDEKTGKITSINYNKVKETPSAKAEETTTETPTINDDIVDVAPEDVTTPTETLEENNPTEMVAEEKASRIQELEAILAQDAVSIQDGNGSTLNDREAVVQELETLKAAPVQETTPSTEREQEVDVNEGRKLIQIATPLTEGERDVLKRGETPNQFKVVQDAIQPRKRGGKTIPSQMEQAIALGEITADEAITAIESAGLEVPPSIKALQATQTTEQGVSSTQSEIVATEASNEATGDVLPNFVAKNKAGGNIRPKTYKRTPEGKWQTIDKDGKVLANVGEAIAQQLEAERTRIQSNTPSGTNTTKTTTTTPEEVQTTVAELEQLEIEYNTATPERQGEIENKVKEITNNDTFKRIQTEALKRETKGFISKIRGTETTNGRGKGEQVPSPLSNNTSGDVQSSTGTEVPENVKPTTGTGETAAEIETTTDTNTELELEAAPATDEGEPLISDPGSPKSMHRFTWRKLKTSSLPEDFKEAIRTGARTKTPFPDEMRDKFAQEFTEGVETVEDIQEAVEALVEQIRQKVGLDDGLAPATGAWEITALRILEKKVYDFHGANAAAKIHNVLQSLSSLSGHMLRSYVGNDNQHMFFVEVFGRLKKTESPLLDKETKSGKTTNEIAAEVSDIIDETTKENLEELRAKVREEILAEIEASKQKPKTSTEEKPTTTSKLIKSLNDKASKYLDAYNKKVGTTLQSGINIDALVDYFLYLYYKSAGSLVKAKENLSKKFGEKVVEDNWGIILESDGFMAATEDIARLKLMSALEKTIDITPELQALQQKGKTPSQLIIQSIVRHLNKKNRKPPTRKSIEEIIEQKDLDIDIVNALRSDIKAGLLVVTDLAKRTEIMNQVDDLLASLMQSKMDTINMPWTTKTKTREMVKNSLKSLDLTVDDVIKDLTNRDKLTDTVEEEFISRTGLSKADAAPYVEIIKKNLEEFIFKKIESKVREELNNSYNTSPEQLSKDLNISVEDAEKMISNFKNRNNLQTIAEAITSVQEQIQMEKDVIKDLNEKIANIQQNDSNLKSAVLNYKTLRTEALKKLNNLEKDLKDLEKKRANKVQLIEQKAGNITNESTLKQIGFIVRNEGLNVDSIREIFAQKIGAKAFGQKDADKLRDLYNAFDSKTFETDKKRSYEELAAYIFRLNPESSAWMADVLESYMYSSILSAIRTSDLALIAGLGNFAWQQVAIGVPMEIGKDLANIFKGKLTFENIRALGSAYANIFNSDFSIRGMGEVLVGAKGLNVQDYGGALVDNKSQNSLSILKRMRELRDMLRSTGGTTQAIRAAGIQAGIGLNVLARGLVVSDYIVTSNALPIILHRNLREEAVAELKQEGLVDPGLALILERVNEKLGLDKIEDQLKLEGFTKGPRFSRQRRDYDKRKADLMFEFLPEDSLALIQAEDYIGKMTLAGRASGNTGWALAGVNKFFRSVSTSLTNKIPEAVKNSSTLLMLGPILKLNTMPFAGAMFKIMQQWKNNQFFGAIQFNKDEDGKTVWRSPLQLVKEDRYYNSFNNKIERVPLSNWNRQERVAQSLLPTLAMIGMLSYFFDDEDDEIVLNKDNHTYFTTDYNPNISKILTAANVTYEPYTAYDIRKDSKGSWKVERLYNYKDFLFLWPLACIGTIQERKVFAREDKEGAFDTATPKDPIKYSDAVALMSRSTLAFGIQNNLTNSIGAVTAITPMIEGKPADGYEVNRVASSAVRMLVPASALQAEIQNYFDFITEADRKKGAGFMADVFDRMITTGWAIDTEDFDVLGRPIRQQQWGPLITTGITSAINAYKGDPKSAPRPYQELEDYLVKYADASQLGKFNTIVKADKELGQTVVETIEDPIVVHELKLYAQQRKAEILQEYVDGYKLDFPGKQVDKATWQEYTKKANEEGNQLGWIYYYNKALDNSGELGRKVKTELIGLGAYDADKSTQTRAKIFKDHFIGSKTSAEMPDGKVASSYSQSYKITGEGKLEKTKNYIQRFEKDVK